MSLSASVVAVKADARDSIREVLEMFAQRPLEMRPVPGWEAALEAMRYPRDDSPRTTVHKAVTLCGGWTVVMDPEMLMAVDADACARLSERFRAPVFAMICQGTSGTYAFSWYNAGQRRRFWLSDGEVMEDDGDPIPEEAGIDLRSLFEDGVLLIMERAGLRYADLESASSFEVWALDESHLMASKAQPPAPRQRGAKPWWKVW
jgi:hypothetical protein